MLELHKNIWGLNKMLEIKIYSHLLYLWDHKITGPLQFKQDRMKSHPRKN